MASVNIQLAPYISRSGKLHMYAALAEARSGEEHLVRIQNLVKEYQPRPACGRPALGADQIRRLSQAALAVAQRLIHMS